ncbi:MAG: hypothetical protein GX803_09085 [Lentisphaerae bacterium]|nr:hypothetical protein [Lentisphaerota bacterium]
MKIKHGIYLVAVAIIGGFSGCATVPQGQPETMAADSGYFLSMKQKGQLIGTGRIQDDQGDWYDVLIVPGYVEPARRTTTYMRMAGEDFGEYFRADKYRDLTLNSKAGLIWAYDVCLTDFMIKGVPWAWGKYWTTANERSRQRVFGWWFAYPWALLESTVDTAVRVPVGLAGAAIGTAWGVAGVPGYYALNSATKGTWHLAADAVLFPAVACTWNTAIAPPLAMLGQKPAPSRVDGFWVRQLTDGQACQKADITPEETEALAALGRQLMIATQPFEDRRKAVDAEREAMYRKTREMEEIISKEEEDTLHALVGTLLEQEGIENLRNRESETEWTFSKNNEVRRYLRDAMQLSDKEIRRVMHLLNQYVPSEIYHHHFGPKTDPLKRSIELFEDVRDDLTIF